MIELEATFEEVCNLNCDETAFDKIENPPCKRPDLCAFLLLDRLVPGDESLIYSIGDGEVFLSVDVEKLAQVATREDVLYLVRCGVSWFGVTEYNARPYLTIQA
jgi:hypothetical protein